MRELRGLVEAQSQEIENLKRRQRDQYLDLDGRLGALSSGGRVAASPTAPGPVAGLGATGASSYSADDNDTLASRPAAQPVVPPIQPATEPEVGVVASGDPAVDPGAGSEDRPEVRAPLDATPEITTLADPGGTGARALTEPTEAERQAYDQAFLALRETRYADAAEGFDRFLRDHPQSSYAPNALYWLGEAYYVTRDFATALGQFQRLLEVYPDSGKQPDALLKIGFSHYELSEWERARAALEQVIADYPGTNYSRLAENRLRTMRLEGNL